MIYVFDLWLFPLPSWLVYTHIRSIYVINFSSSLKDLGNNIPNNMIEMDCLTLGCLLHPPLLGGIVSKDRIARRCGRTD